MAEELTCANCGGTNNVEYRTPDMDIKPVPLCVICVVMGLDWQEQMGRRRDG